MKSKREQSLLVIIPMYNEQAGVRHCVNRVLSVLPSLPWNSRLLIVDDGSRDKTPRILRELQHSHPHRIEVLTHPNNFGYGAGLVTGIKKAQALGFSWCLFMDSDLTNPPEDIIQFIERAAGGDADLVKASRYMRGGDMVGVPYFRRLISQLGNFWGRVTYRMGIHDYSNGFRMGKTEVLAAIPYRERKFAIILEEMYYLKKMGARVVEIPNILTSRTGTLSTFHYTPQTFWDYLKYTLKAAVI